MTHLASVAQLVATVPRHRKPRTSARAQIDAGLVAVIQAWPRLPEAIRAGILAMIRAVD
jgi:hypothetical protein